MRSFRLPYTIEPVHRAQTCGRGKERPPAQVRIGLTARGVDDALQAGVAQEASYQHHRMFEVAVPDYIRVFNRLQDVLLLAAFRE